MTEVHIFRHGETEWNLDGRMQGFKDSALTNQGRKQAVEAREKVKSIEFDVAYSSTSSRAIETVEILLNKCQIPIYALDDLREINMGIWEGMKKSDVQQEYSDEYFNFWNRPSHFKVIQGETFLQLAIRSVAIIKDIIRNHEGKKILVVSHAAFIKTLLTSLQSRPLDELWEGPFAENLSHSILIKDPINRICVKKFCDKIWNNNLITEVEA